MTPNPTEAPTHEQRKAHIREFAKGREYILVQCFEVYCDELAATSEHQSARIAELERENAELREFKSANLRRALEQK